MNLRRIFKQYFGWLPKHTGALFLSLVLLISLSFNLLGDIPSVTATQGTLDKIKEREDELKSAENNLDNVHGSIDEWKGQQNNLKGSLYDLNTNLTDISERITELEEAIRKKEEEIDRTKTKLRQAEDDAAMQYKAMKERIRYVYENERSKSTFVDVLFTANSFSDILNQVDYLSRLEAYDRRKLEEYRAVIEVVSSLMQELETQQSELNIYLAQMEEQQNLVQTEIRSTSNKIANYGDQISGAETAALLFEEQIRQAENDIVELKKKYQEELRLSQLASRSAMRDLSMVTFADGDRDLLAAIIYCEAGGEPYIGQVAVGAVVINRILSTVFPDTMVGVIYANKQFSPVASGRLALALAEGKATQSCYSAADAAMRGESPVGSCFFFRTPIEGLNGMQIGGHIFY